MTADSPRSTLRLTLAGFGQQEASDIATMVLVSSDEQAPWTVVGTPPYDAVLIARGTRAGDSNNVCVLRVAHEVGAESAPADQRRQLPLLLPRPIEARTLRLALEAAIARLKARGRDPRA